MKKNILFVINTLGRAGAERALVTMIKRLDPDKFNISLYVCLGQGELINEIPEYVHIINDTYDSGSVLSSEGKKRLMLNLFRQMLKNGAIFKNIPYIVSNVFFNITEHRKTGLEKLLWSVVADSCRTGKEKQADYDLAVAYIEGASAYYVDRYIDSSVKKAAFIHIDYAQAGYSRRLDRNCYQRFDRVFTVSGEVREAFLKAYPECQNYTKVFNNMIDTDDVKFKAGQGSACELADDGRIKLLTVCRLTPQKALQVSVGAMRLLTERGTDAVWYVVGDGPEKNRLSELIKKYGLEDRFILLGARDNPYPYYRAADIYVHATKYEGKSIAIQEAQILRCPVIASDCSGNREQIADGIDGYLCRFDEDGIASAIEKMVADREKWKDYADAAEKKVCANDKELEKLYELFDES